MNNEEHNIPCNQRIGWMASRILDSDRLTTLQIARCMRPHVGFQANLPYVDLPGQTSVTLSSIWESTSVIRLWILVNVRETPAPQIFEAVPSRQTKMVLTWATHA